MKTIAASPTIIKSWVGGMLLGVGYCFDNFNVVMLASSQILYGMESIDAVSARSNSKDYYGWNVVDHKVTKKLKETTKLK